MSDLKSNLEIIELDKEHSKLFLVAKVGEKLHLEALRKGKIRCRKLNYYKNNENKKKPFFDQDEGISSVLQSDKIKLKMEIEGHGPIELSKESGLTGFVRLAFNHEQPTFCMYSVSVLNSEFDAAGGNLEELQRLVQPSEKIKEHGDHVWIIHDFNEFIDRLKIASKDQSVGFTAGLVHYVDFEQVHGRFPDDLHGFVKNKGYSHEREYRIIFNTNTADDVFYFEVGDLSDISAVMPVEKFLKGTQIKIINED